MRFSVPFLFSLLCLCYAITLGPVVQTVEGPVQGEIVDNIWIHRSIPFAAPPTGNNRLRPPQPVTHWKTTKKVTENGHICPQIKITDLFHLGDEDCLTLDVYAPETALKSDPLPVFVWIYGGGFSLGDKYEFGWYDAKNIVNSYGYVFVAMNYRVGPLGFLALDELKNESSTTGNYGVQDQRYALEWVQRNIKNFGGDPTRVTIFGESAGAFSTCWHLVNPLSRPLFNAAILESGTCDAPQFFVEYDAARSFGESFTSHVGCDNSKLTDAQFLECLRKLPVKHIMTKLIDFNPDSFKPGAYHPVLYPFMPFGPAIDGTKEGLLDVPLRLIDRGEYNQVPVIMGTNNDEGTIFVPIMLDIVPKEHLPLDATGYNTALLWFFNQNQTFVDNIGLHYNVKNYKSYDDMAAKLLRDYFFVCSTRRALLSMSKWVPNKLYNYHFDYMPNFIDDKILGDYHTSELDFVFDNPWPPVVHIFNAADKLMASTMGGYWSNLVWANDPNAPTRPLPQGIKWPSYNSTDLLNIVFDAPMRVESNYLGAQCDYWDISGANEMLRSVRYPA